MSRHFDKSKPMFWSEEVELKRLNLELLSLQDIGTYTLPIPETEICGLADKVRSGKFGAHQKGTGGATITLDASLVTTGKTVEQQNQFYDQLHRLAYTALRNATNMDSNWIPVNSKVCFKKAIVCLPGGDYKSINKFAAVESGFIGTLLLQLPIQKGYEDACLHIVNKCGVLGQVDLAKNSCANFYLTLLINQSSTSLLHFEITPPSSGAVIVLVYHLVWLDSVKLSPNHSTLPSFLSLTTKLSASVKQANASATIRDGDSSALFYLRLPGLPTPEGLDSKPQKGEANDMMMALTSLKQYEIVRVLVGTKTSNSIAIIKIENNGNSKLIPQEWAGSVLQVIHIAAEDSPEVIVEANEEFGALIVPRKELLVKSCLSNFRRVIDSIHERFLIIQESGIPVDQLLYDLNVVAQYVMDQHYCLRNESTIDDVDVLLNLLIRANLSDVCITVLKNIQVELLSKIKHKTSPCNNPGFLKSVTGFFSKFCSRVDNRDIFKPVQKLVGDGQPAEVNQLILNALNAHSSALNKKKNSFTVEDIHDMVDSLSTVVIPPNASRSVTKLTAIGKFFLQFTPKALAEVLITFKAKHMPIHRLYPDLYTTIFREVSHADYKRYQSEKDFLYKLTEHYFESEDTDAFARVFVHTTFHQGVNDARFKLFCDFLILKMKSWSDMKTLHDAIEVTRGGFMVLQKLFERLLRPYNKPDHQLKGTSQSKKNNKTKIKYPAAQTLVRFFALGICCRKEYLPQFGITRYCRNIINSISEQHVHQLFTSLLDWDSENLKKNDYTLGLVTDVINALIVHFSSIAMDMCDSGVYTKIGDCLAWRKDSLFSEKVVAEIINKINGIKKEKKRNSRAIILQGIFQSSLAFGRETLQKPLIKDKLIDEMLGIWVTLIASCLQRSSDPSPYFKEIVVSCIVTFFKARKLNLYMPSTLTKVQELHKMANALDLANLILIFEQVHGIEIDPVRPVSRAVDSVSWRLYVSMCTLAIANPQLEAYLKTCELEKAGHLYGFALWVGNKLLLDRLNEKIISLSPSDSRICLREALPDWPAMKRLAVDACSKEALKLLSGNPQNDYLKEKPEKRKLPDELFPAAENNRILDEQATHAAAPDGEEPLMKKIKIELSF